MRSLPSAPVIAVAALLAALAALANPSPARANVACDLGGAAAGALSKGAGAITGGVVGAGNPLGDACDAVSGGLGGALGDSLSGALKGVGNDVFAQITTWVSEGASWLIGKVVAAIERSTTPRLTTKGFLTAYAKMAAIAALLGAAMLLAAVLEGLAQGNAALLLRAALVNLPLAFIATSVAYLFVQLALSATDGLCEAIAAGSGHDATRFFEAAISGLGKGGAKIGSLGGAGPVGEADGAVGAPLFVTFLAATIGAFAAFFVWIELLMRDAAVYVVALFLPLFLVSSIWPRWGGVLRRGAELLVAVIGSKFVIVAIVSLAAALLAEPQGRVEPLLGAAALMLLACFAPFLLLKLVPFAEGAMAAAYSRRSAGGGALGGMQLASDVQIVRNMARSGWSGEEDSGVSLWSAAERTRGLSGGGERAGGAKAGDGAKASGEDAQRPSPGSRPKAARGSGSSAAGATAGAGGTSGGEGATGAGALPAGGPGALAAAPTMAARGAQGAAKRLQDGGVAKGVAPETSRPQSGGEEARKGSPAPRPQAKLKPDEGDSAPPGGPAESPPRPAPDPPDARPEKGKEK